MAYSWDDASQFVITNCNSPITLNDTTIGNSGNIYGETFLDSGTVTASTTASTTTSGDYGAMFNFGANGLYVNNLDSKITFGSSTGTEATYTNTVTLGTGATITDTNYSNTLIIADGPNTFNNVTFKDCIFEFNQPSEKELKRQAMMQKVRDNCAYLIKTRANIIKDVPANELVAIETLREEITEAEFRKYMKFGFINVRGESGNIYQIFRNKTHIKVWESGQIVEEICIYLPDENVPKTDKVIAFKTMIETNESEFKTFGNVYNMRKAA